ncbi:MAG: efflux RND transporter periplasmic adaptor subunit [Burkholderiales bacterium]|nr:efflux RND transporter periplasmic adaptor subunit [Burkholderiales bacterium]
MSGSRESRLRGLSWPLVVLACALAVAGCKEKAAPSGAAPPPKPAIKGGLVTFAAGHPQLAALKVAAVRDLDNVPVEMTGRLVWDENRTVRIYAPLAGRVTRIGVQAGDTVKAGQVLAWVAAPDLGQAQADASRGAADFALAEKTLARVKDLHENGVAARKDLTQAEAEHARARAELERAQARVRLYGGGAGIDQTLAIKSPISGTVVERNLNPGQELRADQGAAPALFVVTDPSRLWIQIDAHERHLPVLRKGGEFAFTAANYQNTVFTARLDVVADFIDPQTRVIRARGSVANDDRRLKGEMLVTARFSTAALGSVGIPAQAVVFAEGRQFAFVERANGAFERVEVRIGEEHAGQLVIRKGLSSGQRVVTDGALLLQQVMQAGRSRLEAE